jgi:hypothetical protein
VPRGRRESALITLVSQLDALDTRRRKLVAEIQHAASGLSGGPLTSVSSGGMSKGGRRPGFKLSAEARAKISAAQKKRWAKTKKAAEK